jgi:hypothetical protein
MSSHAHWHNVFKTPLQPAVELMSQEEMVRRIELIREREGFDGGPFGAIPDPLPLPIGRICEPAFLRRAS